MSDDERLTFTLAETAKLLGLSRSTAYRAADSGDIPTIRLRGRRLVPRAALEGLVGSPAGYRVSMSDGRYLVFRPEDVEVVWNLDQRDRP